MRKTQRVSGEMGPVGGAVFWLAIGAAAACLIVGVSRGDATFNFWEALAAIATSIGVITALREGRSTRRKQFEQEQSVKRRAASSFLIKCFGLNAKLSATLLSVRRMAKGESYPDAHRLILVAVRELQADLSDEKNAAILHLDDRVAYRIEAANQMLLAAIGNHEMSAPVHGFMNESGVRVVIENMLAFADAAHSLLKDAVIDAAKDGDVEGLMRYWPDVGTTDLSSAHYNPPKF